MDQQDTAKKLYQARLMRTPEEVKSFEEARLALISSRDPAVLSDLFAAFDDATEQSEVMWNLLHTVEVFGWDVYLRALAEATPTMLPHAREWAVLLHERALNADEGPAVYSEILPTLTQEVKEAVKKVLEEIDESSPPLFRERTQAVLKVLAE